MNAILNVHDVLLSSRANGPGRRAVVWVQGCARHCRGCFNPETWSFAPRRVVAVKALADELLAGAPDGVSISGGEPLAQAGALVALLRRLRARWHAVSPRPQGSAVAPAPPVPSILVFSGFTRAQIARRLHGPEILALTDVLVAGPYRHGRHLGRGLLGSANQRLHLLSARHAAAEFAKLPQAEVAIAADGVVRISGVFPPRLLESAGLR